jgi:hypothetical protein
MEPPEETPPTPDIKIPKGKREPTKPKPVSTVDDTEREEEKIQVEEKPSHREKAGKLTERVIKAIGPTQREAETPDKPEYYTTVKDTERKMEVPATVEEKPPGPDRSSEIWTESERAFRGVSTQIRETSLGFREEAKRKQDVYSKTAYEAVGLGLRAGASAWDALTIGVRPVFLTETAIRAKTAISKPVETIGEFGKAIMTDPLGVTADIGGGFIGGHALSNVLRKTGIIKPSSYKLDKKIGTLDDVSEHTGISFDSKTGYVTDISETPAHKWPRGQWRSTWEIARKGGTSIVELEKRKGLYAYWEPVPVYPLSSSIPTLLGGIASVQGPDIDVKTKVDQEVKEILMIGTTPKTKILVDPQITPIEQAETIGEDIWIEPQIKTIPDQVPIAIQTPKKDIETRQREKVDPIIELGIITTVSTVPESIMKTRTRRATKKKIPLRMKTPRDISVISLSKLWGEKRRYPIATRKQLEKELFGK